MPGVILKPHLLSYKNRLLGRGLKNRFVNRDLVVVIIASGLMLSVYHGVILFLEYVGEEELYADILPVKLISFALMGVFMLLCLSNCLTALGSFYSSKDVPLLLTAPISMPRLYATKIFETMLISGWMLIVLAVPTTLAFMESLDLSWYFFIATGAVMIPLLIIPAALSGILVTLFVNLIPAHRVREFISVVALLLVVGLIITGPVMTTEQVPTGAKSTYDTLFMIAVLQEPHPFFFPSRWASDLLAAFLIPHEGTEHISAALLVMTTMGFLAVGYLIFDWLFLRGWTLATQSQKNLRIESSEWLTTLGRVLLPLNSQFRAMVYKEGRMFIRDATQWFQLLLLLMLTFIYLYNFRALQFFTDFSAEGEAWWQVLLALSNVSLGACVIAAISTRFVFPTVSLEGRAFVLVRSAPLEMKQLLRYKFLIWIVPVGAMSIILLVSGAWAINATPETIMLSAFLGIALSIGIVGLAVGVGAVYAKFDWQSPTQVAASFGSLVYMLLSMATIAITLIPASFLLILTNVPHITAQFPKSEFRMAVACSYFLVMFINVAAARGALSAGRQSLLDREK